MATLTLAINAQGMVAGERVASQAVDRVNEGARRASRGVSRLERRFGTLGRSARTLFNNFGPLFGIFSGAFIGRSTVRTISNFEEALTRLAGVATASSSSLEEQIAVTERLERVSRNTGATTRFTATESAEGLLFLARAGFSAQASISALPGTLNLATTGNISLAESADIATSVISQFQLRAGQTNEVVDSLVITANRSKTSVDQLAEALTNAGPAAASVEESVQFTAAALGVLSDRGINASRAGVGLRQALIRLTNPTLEARKAIAELGLTAEELDPQTTPAIEIFERLRNANIGLGESAQIFGTRQANTGLVLAQSTERIRELIAAQSEYRGEAERLTNQLDQTLRGSFLGLISAIQELILQFGDSGFSGALRSAIVTTTGALRIFAGLESAVSENREEAFLLVRALQTAGAALGTFVTIRTIDRVLTLGTSFRTVAAAVRTLTAAMASNPIGLVAVAVSSAVAALVFYRDELVTIQGTTAQVGDFTLAVFSVVQDAIGGIPIVVNEAVVAFTERWQAGLDFIDRSSRDLFGGSLIDVVKGAGNFIIGIFDFLSRSFDNTAERLFTVFNALASFDFESPLQSARESFRILREGLSPGDIIGDIQGDLEEAFTTDFIGDFAENGSEFGRTFLENFDRAFDISGLASDVSNGVDDILDEVRRRAAARAQDRTFGQAAEASVIAQSEILKTLFGFGGQDGTSNSVGVKFDVDPTGLEEAEEGLDRLARKGRTVGDSIGDSLGSALGATIFQADELEDSLENIAENLLQNIFQQTVADPLSNLIGGALGSFGTGTPVASATGNAFSGGSVVPFQTGGSFLQGPTLFPLAGGRTGIGGEAGPEAILPLERGPNGVLGVQSTGGSNGPQSITVNINGVTDMDSFRKNQRQVTSSIRRAVNGT